MLSVVTICKNEINNVRGFIASWSDVADEIIIMDTGSNDGTYQLLLELEKTNHKLRIYNFIWIQDFSAARNFAASYALGTWILWADMDDRIHIESIPRIRELVRSSDCVYAFQVASDMGKNRWHRFMQIRMYPNIPSMKFHGKIHESLNLSLKMMKLEVKCDDNVMIAHLGYADENLKKQKAIRNLDLLLHDDYPSTPDALAQVGDSLYVLGKFKAGMGFYEEAVRKSHDQKAAKLALAEKLIVGYLHWNAMDKAIEIIHSFLEKTSVAYAYWLAEYYRMQGANSTAKIHYELCLNGSRSLGLRECNADAMIYEAKQRLQEVECAPASV